MTQWLTPSAGHRLVEAVRGLPGRSQGGGDSLSREMPVKEIAIALGISEGNASVRLHRAKSAIKLSFGDSL